jgi:hypothetical protein
MKRTIVIMALWITACGSSVTVSEDDTPTTSDVSAQADASATETGTTDAATVDEHVNSTDVRDGAAAPETSDALTMPDAGADALPTPDVATPDSGPDATPDVQIGPPPCGGVGEPCCAGGAAWVCTAAWSECVNEYPMCVACGGVGQTPCGWYDNHEGSLYVSWTTYGCNPAVATFDLTAPPGSPCVPCGVLGGPCCIDPVTGVSSCANGNTCNPANNQCQ